MRQKVAIITLNHGVNYGNKLQNYAVQRIYEKMVMKAETIRLYPEGLKVESKGKKKNVFYFIKRVKNRMNERMFAGRIKKRKQNFDDFNNNILKMTSRTYTPQTYHEIRECDYDYFSVGSDQVWNTYFFDFTPMYLLDFVSDSSKKIAFSASFGVDDISPGYYEKAISNLKQFKAISVREQKGINILHEIVGVPATLVLDPTLYLSADEWEKIIQPIDKEIPHKYVFMYFLGDLDRAIEREIYRIAKADGCKIIRMNELKSRYYSCGPLEFVYFIRNAAYVYTDSFHAVCFSLQFHKKFVVIPRVSQGKPMGSRLDSLLDLLGLTNRVYSIGDHVKEEIDYCDVDRILSAERTRTEKFLREAFSEEG